MSLLRLSTLKKHHETLKIHKITAVIIIILLCVWVVQFQNDIKETEKILQQYSDRYYQETGV